MNNLIQSLISSYSVALSNARISEVNRARALGDFEAKIASFASDEWEVEICKVEGWEEVPSWSWVPVDVDGNDWRVMDRFDARLWASLVSGWEWAEDDSPFPFVPHPRNWSPSLRMKVKVKGE